jgi:hypothetical protein
VAIACQLWEVLKVSLGLVWHHSFHLKCFPYNQVFKDATLFFSRDGIPNLVTVIPAMDCINDVLTANSIDQQFSAPIWAALTIGKWMLTHYYSKTDLSDVYWIMMGIYLLLLSDRGFLMSFQFSTLATNSSTLRTLDGLKSGARQPIMTYVTCLRYVTNRVQRSKHQVTKYAFQVLLFQVSIHSNDPHPSHQQNCHQKTCLMSFLCLLHPRHQISATVSLPQTHYRQLHYNHRSYTATTGGILPLPPVQHSHQQFTHITNTHVPCESAPSFQTHHRQLYRNHWSYTATTGGTFPSLPAQHSHWQFMHKHIPCQYILNIHPHS